MGKVKEELEKHLVTSTGLLVVANPIYAAYETTLAGMSDLDSSMAKIIASGAQYALGLGWAYNKGRQKWRDLFDIDENTSDSRQRLHDRLFLSTFTLGILPPIYTLSSLVQGTTPDLVEISTATGIGGGLGLLVLGPILGYAEDISHDLMGIKKCNRKLYPNLIKRQDSKTKKKIASLGVAAFLAALGGIYSVTPDNFIDDVRNTYFNRFGLEAQVNQEDLEERPNITTERVNYGRSWDVNPTSGENQPLLL